MGSSSAIYRERSRARGWEGHEGGGVGAGKRDDETCQASRAARAALCLHDKTGPSGGSSAEPLKTLQTLEHTCEL